MIDIAGLTSALPESLGSVNYMYASFRLVCLTTSFFPINDNDDPTAGHGGSHWLAALTAHSEDRSLLVVNRVIKIGFHYDSLNHRNEEAAKETLGKIGILLNERKFRHSFSMLTERF
jgi:hypothetical protein